MAALWDWLPLILSIVGVLGVGGVILLLGFWPVVTSFLIGTSMGRAISAIGAVALALMWAFVAGRRKGAERVRAEQKAKTWKAIKAKVKIDEEVKNLTPVERRKRLNRWVRE